MADLATARAAIAAPEVIELADARDAYAPDEVVAAYDAHQRGLFSFALASTRCREAAEDLVQEAFAGLIETMAAGTTPVNVRAWLYHVLANLVTSRARRRIVAGRWLPTFFSRATAPPAEAEFLSEVVDPRIPAALDRLSEA